MYSSFNIAVCSCAILFGPFYVLSVIKGHGDYSTQGFHIDEDLPTCR